MGHWPERCPNRLLHIAKLATSSRRGYPGYRKSITLLAQTVMRVIPRVYRITKRRSRKKRKKIVSSLFKLVDTIVRFGRMGM